MLRGMTLFKCTQCGEKFKAPDIEPTVKLEVQLLHRLPPTFPLRSKDGGRRWKPFFGPSSNTKQKRETAVSHGLITFVLQIYVQALNP